MRFTYDDRADALYVAIREDTPVAKSLLVGAERVVDLDERGDVIGIEVLGASEGVQLSDLVERFELVSEREGLLHLETSSFHPVELA